jgi:hypothetical protein
MPTIPNFPGELLDQHHNWHTPGVHPSVGPGRAIPMGAPGAGIEFLTFHRNFLAQFHAWYDTTGFTQPPFDDAMQKITLVAPWTSVPAELRDPSLGWTQTWADDETRLATDVPDFASADELGTFIETGIHNNFLHGAAAEHYGEPLLAGFHSPQSTFFYKIHGLVDHWWSLWQLDHKLIVKELIKEIADDVLHKRVARDLVKERFPEVKDRFGEVKLAAFDVPDEPRTWDPIVLASLEERLSRVETEIFPQRRTFIRATQRPPVGDAIAEGELGHRHDRGERET